MYDLIVIGGGPAGLAAAESAWNAGLRKVLIVERAEKLGGILNQCIHNGFGLHHFKEELTGPEYAQRCIDALDETGIEVRTDTMVLDIDSEKRVHMTSPKYGYSIEETKTVILAMGCRERARGAIGTPGTRPAGVYTAGAAQKYVNMEGFLPGKRIVILGSGDIGLIMARRLTLEGCKVLACVEVMERSSGLNRNIAQCLRDFNIPLLLSHTVTDVRGKDRVEQVVVSRVDENKKPIPGTEIVYDCDTLLLSVGLIPENELTRQAGIEINPVTKGPLVYSNLETSMEGVFACGNVVHVHDLADSVSSEAEKAGKAAANFVLDHAKRPEELLDVKIPRNIATIVPETEDPGVHHIVCIACPNGCLLTVDERNGFEVSGNRCSRGKDYGESEVKHPVRTVTSSVFCKGLSEEKCPVKTSREIPKSKIFDVISEIKKVHIDHPVKMGDVIIKNVCGLNSDIIAARSIE